MRELGIFVITNGRTANESGSLKMFYSCSKL